LVTVSTAAFALKTGNFSDAAFLNKVAKCGGWFKRISAGLALSGLIAYAKAACLEGRYTLAVDAAYAVEKRRSGATTVRVTRQVRIP
jgi:hypothetical protein